MPTPSKYKEEYSKMLIEHMSEGMSFETFGAKVKAHRATLHRWREKYPEFREAYELGKLCSQAVWERIGLDGARGDLDKFNAASFCFNMKNRFGWRDKMEVENIGPAQKLIIDLGDTDGKEGTE